MTDYGEKLTSVANAASNQISPVDLLKWAGIPAGIGLIIGIIIVLIWQPKFSGSYTYYKCPPSSSNDPRNLEKDKDCEKKTGSVAKRNVIILVLMFILIPVIFAGIGFKIGFIINNPKIYAGVYATGLFRQSLK
tara:strand:+ start:6096 stop:6497 length:402 start_codon:yes stop_codon:yes gene_type:complete